ncbi:hypothetical protein [Legionella fairfieldensis]|uniref:hypothetical protein n=1 Tax=Legionella fairfieldensis TaxID=45064 RepID=UPI000AC3D959|nr:hypothetical protein [Legionella fairfieldensis]
MLALLYSFFDPEYGQELLEKVGAANFVDARSYLDQEGIGIISELWNSHYGW